MPRLITRLPLTTTIPRTRPARALALVAIIAMLVGSLAPAWAIGAEAESEGEGQGTAPPRLGNPEYEPGGPETVLEGFGGATGGEEVEEDEVVPPVEAEPPQEVEVPEAAPEIEEAPAVPPVEEGAETPQASPPPAVAAAPTSPEYAPSPTPPTYETSPPPSSQPVQNEAIVAPKAAESSPSGQATPKQPAQTSPPQAPSEEPAAPSTPASTLPAVPAADAGRQGPGRIAAGRSAYTVHPGDCLWSIAEALLPPGADNARIVAEVDRLWSLNAERIGTGDPNLILVGTQLRLG